MMLSFIGKKKMLFWGKTVKFCQNHKKRENICSIHISLTFSRCKAHRTKSRDYKKGIYITRIGQSPGCIKSFQHFWGKIVKICAKLARNWKIFVVFMFEDEMLLNFACEQIIVLYFR